MNDERQRALLGNYDVGLKAASAAISLCCYLTGRPEIEERWPSGSHTNLVEKAISGTPRDRQNARSELTRLSILPFNYVKGPQIERGSAGPSGRTVAVHWRRGHFRAVAVGSGREGRELRWIKPTLVNAKTGGNADQIKVYRERRSLPKDLH